jgi:acetylglutamate kinase
VDKLYIIKIGGNIIDDETKLSSFLDDFSSVNDKKILVHGGGKLATRMAEQLGIEQKLIDGETDNRCGNAKNRDHGLRRLYQ